ncbi:hypothetical protein V1521DRAFT_443022 [Lipomyces starkeyi]
MGGWVVYKKEEKTNNEITKSPKSSPMESTKVFVDNVDTFLSRIPAVIAQHLLAI